jgi:ATP-dependent protease ClpP protease subunit
MTKNSNDDKIMINMSSTGMIPPKHVSTVHEFYISGNIEEPENYIQMFDTIRHADESDVVKFYINSYGGDLFTAIQFMRVIAESNATVIASVEGACMSAATMLFLCADQFEVTPHSIFMFHNYSGGTIGKGGEMIDQLQHERKWSKSLMTEIYANFLTEDEIEHMLDNKDYWMDGKEVVQRLNKRNQLLLDSVTEKPKKVSTKKLPVPATKSMPTKKAAAKKVKPKVN